MRLSVRIVNALEERSVILAEDLLAQSYESLMQTPNFGAKALSQVKRALVKLGLEPPSWTRPAGPAPGDDGEIFSLW
jgi:DNA-directed RNA polymerase alpha subunit